MSTLLSAVGIAIVTLISAVFLRTYKPEYAVLVSLAGFVIAITLCIGQLTTVFSKLKELMSAFSSQGGIFRVIIKSLGVCLVADFAAIICKDFGLGSLANGVELAGKIIVLGLTLPIVESVVEVAVELIK